MSNHFYVLVFTLCLAMCAVSAEDEETKNCVNSKMRVCNFAVKNHFMNAIEGTPVKQVYCGAMKALFDCVKNQLGDDKNLCKSDTLRKYYFIVLAYLRMDKIMGTCTQDVQEIKSKILERLAPDSIEEAEDFVEKAFDDDSEIPDCAKSFHIGCVKEFVGKEKESDDLCSGVNNFIQCYDKKKCADVSVSFAKLINKMSAYLINAFAANQMCTVKKSEF